MTRRVTFHRLAKRELQEAAAYYDSASSGLGAEFLKEIERCIRFIDDYPEASAVLSGSLRRRLALRFPYGVLYSIKPDRIRILAIMHLKRHPAYWVGRK